MIRTRHNTVKVIVAGQGGVGKTTMLKRYQSGKFLPAITTIGVNFIVKDIEFMNKTITLSIWDYAGEERFQALFPSYCNGSNGALVVFDLTRPQTLNELDPWIRITREQNGNIPIILVGTKQDLIHEVEDFNFLLESGKRYCEKRDLKGVYFSSSMTGKGIDEIFSFLAFQITSHREQSKSRI